MPKEIDFIELRSKIIHFACSLLYLLPWHSAIKTTSNEKPASIPLYSLIVRKLLRL